MKSILKSADRSKRDSIGSLETSRISELSVGGGSEKKVRFLKQARESRNKSKKGLSLFDNYMSGIDKSVKKSEGVFLNSGQ
jgi:PBP1b-binding outer membrane lipoprotein LpoB